ncbi:hypothetical protein [Streptomyces sp. I05A-00742]|uniref:hypothetical protein n=1 Tax=Streptomyces sp. I05A-00742 TaxID=2732853 RepID=UPI001489E340|nr:hypothetical protein [Streptomyces sp. I05A-00742]
MSSSPLTLRLSPSQLQVILVGQDRPALGAGTYTLTATQEVRAGSETLGTLSDNAEFTVSAPRFALEPSDVTAVNPPPGADGGCSLTLPHVVLTHSELPWARTVTEAGVPWMALVVLTGADVLTEPATGEAVRAGTVQDLLTPPAGVLGPALDAPHDEAKLPCQYVDLTIGAATDVLPHLEELRWLAHVRDVSLDLRARSGKDEFAPGRRAVVTANRFPRIPKTLYTAVLVSVEGHTGYTYLGGQKAVPPATRAVRMAVLRSWSFTTGASGTEPDFHALARELADATRQENRLRLAATGCGKADGDLRTRLEGGHVPVSYQLPTGEWTPAWYRGPFTARPARPLPESRNPPSGADAALIYLEREGIWDVGYACAHTFGRLLAASDPALLKALRDYRSDALVVAQRTHRLSSRPAGPDTPPDARTRFQALVGDQLAREIDDGLRTRDTPPPGAPDPIRPPDTARLAEARGAGSLARAVDGLLEGEGGGRDPGAVALTAALRQVAARHAPLFALAQGPAVQWLLRVPFDHLVPHAAMLPERGARFFHVDAQWMSALFAGVRATGAASRLDTHLADLLGQRVDEISDPRLPVFGGLVRSPLVRHWPDLIVNAYSSTASATAKDKPTPTYVARPLPDVLLMLWDVQPARVVLREPSHGLSMGIDTTDGGGALNLRAPAGTGTGCPLGRQATGLNACVRGSTGRAAEVLTVAEGAHPLTGAVENALREALGDPSYRLTPAGLALQLLNSAGCLELDIP